jgi:steroid 5-alpha reductase family enzyme
MINIILTSFLLILAFVSLVWLLSVWKKDMSIVDIAWGLGFVAVAIFQINRLETMDPRQFLVMYLVAIWGLRLAIFLAIRNLGKGIEDPRYQAFREDWGKNTWWISYFKVFLLQGVLMLIISGPVHAVVMSTTPSLGLIETIGAVVWLIGFLIESTADWQLYRFKRNPANKGKVMDKGLWGWSRHPNYFGETLIWWGIFLATVNTEHWYLSALGALLITFLLLKVSGVTMLEARYEGNDKYADYKRRVSSFIPLPPKKHNN